MKTIKQAAEDLVMTHRALRYYESRGLVSPERRGVTRLYDEHQIKRLQQIKVWTELGLTLEEVGQLLAAKDTGDDAGYRDAAKVIVSRAHTDALAELDRVSETIPRLRAWLASLERRAA